MNEDNRESASGLEGTPGRAGLEAELTPPAGLEQRVVDALRSEALLEPSEQRSTSGRARPGAWLAAVAAALLLGVVGYVLGRWQAAPQPREVTVVAAQESPTLPSQYALLLYETPTFDEGGRDDLRQRYDEYSRWVATVRERGQFVTGEDFAVDRGWTLAPAPAAETDETDSWPRAPAESTLSGMFVIRAASPEDALDLARQLPHLEHGGHVVVQEVVPTDQPPAD